MSFTINSSQSSGDFLQLLSSRQGPLSTPQLAASGDLPVATTVLAFHFAGGVLIAGDRRATAGNLIMYDRADKVIALDEHTVMAIAGTPATAFEMARTLSHSFQYFRRSQLAPLSPEAKVRALGQLLKNNLGMAMQGVGAVVPILALNDSSKVKTEIYFYDILGAQFQAVDFAASGSGSPAVRSILHYVNRWAPAPTIRMKEEEAIQLALQLLDVAAESDSATGGIDRRTQVYPLVKILSSTGLRSVSDDRLKVLFEGSEPLV